MNQIEFKTDGTKNMKNKKGFLQGALCGALAMLLAAGLVSCGLKAKDSNSGEKDTTEAISSETDKKLEKLESLINQYYLKDVDQDELQQGIYEGYIAGLNESRADLKTNSRHHQPYNNNSYIVFLHCRELLSAICQSGRRK